MMKLFSQMFDEFVVTDLLGRQQREENVVVQIYSSSSRTVESVSRTLVDLCGTLKAGKENSQ